MRTVTLRGDTDFDGWRDAARELIAGDVPPDQVHWRVAGSDGSLFDETQATANTASASAQFTVPRAFIQLARRVALHRSPERFALLYRLLWRLRREPHLLDVAVDEDVARATAMAKSVSRDVHKMKAFVRFREIQTDTRPAFVAWFEPEHHIVEAIAPFFMRRFAGQRWSILTPECSVHWDGKQLRAGPGASRRDAPQEDAKEDLWRRYYASIFNPARLKVATMRSQMPQKYWRNLPETSLIPTLVATAERRTTTMLTAPPTTARRLGTRPSDAQAHFQPESLDAVRAGASTCRRCPLWADATQTVFGEGTPDARIVLVGEQPGDREDLAGKPFVGPAGQLLDRALASAGLPRDALYVTNAVKHFKFQPRGKRRLHKKPNEAEIAACKDWLEQEIALTRPALVVVLGATAARALLGHATGIERSRGQVLQRNGQADLLVTVHPSYLLRIPVESHAYEFDRFVADLKLAAPYLTEQGAPATPAPPLPQTLDRQDPDQSPRHL